MTDEKRLELYESLPNDFKELYSSPRATALNKEMRGKYQIREEKLPAYLDTVGDTILGFYKTTDLPRLLQQKVGLTPEKAEQLTAELLQVWGPVLEREKAEAASKKEELASLADKIAAIPPSEPEPLTDSDEPPVWQSALSLRTIDSDTKRAHGYGHQQIKKELGEDRSEPLRKSTPQQDLRTDLYADQETLDN